MADDFEPYLDGFVSVVSKASCECVVFSNTLYVNLRPVLTGGWRHGHGASRHTGKNFDWQRQDLHWNQHQAGETGQRSVDSFSS